MNDYIKDICKIITHGKMENTYKMSWIRSIVETCEKCPKEKIHFDELSPLIFKYYWNQCIYFNLRQSPNYKKKPEIIQLVEEEIRKYTNRFGSRPRRFVEVQDEITIPTSKISTRLKYDVCHRFLNLDKIKLNIYEYDLVKRIIRIPYPEVIKDHSEILYPLINYRWVKKLEEVDGSPRLTKKIIGVDRDGEPKRNNLKSFRRYLDLVNPDRICFVSGKKIDEGDLSIDHLIPWSYMYSDDLWNLVYVSSSVNSSKGNRLPEEKFIQKLEKRNKRLLEMMDSTNLYDSNYDELKLSIEKDFLRHHYIGFKG